MADSEMQRTMAKVGNMGPYPKDCGNISSSPDAKSSAPFVAPASDLIS